MSPVNQHWRAEEEEEELGEQDKEESTNMSSGWLQGLFKEKEEDKENEFQKVPSTHSKDRYSCSGGSMNGGLKCWASCQTRRIEEQELTLECHQDHWNQVPTGMCPWRGGMLVYQVKKGGREQHSEPVRIMWFPIMLPAPLCHLSNPLRYTTGRIQDHPIIPSPLWPYLVVFLCDQVRDSCNHPSLPT